MKNLDSYVFVGVLMLVGMILIPIQYASDHQFSYGVSPAQASENATSDGGNETLPTQEDYKKICSLDVVKCFEEDIEGIITYFAEKYAVDPQILTNLARCESQLNPAAVGDKGLSRGLWQIHKPSNPTISDEFAFDPIKSTEWATQRIKAGELWRWTCARKLGYL
jgi:hypothetical protein